jgi:SAM-dependent methyltransferase
MIELARLWAVARRANWRVVNGGYKLASCPVCGAVGYTLLYKMLTQRLVESWGLSHYAEVAYDEREGGMCLTCGVNLRSRALASAMAWRILGNHAEGFSTTLAHPVLYSGKKAVINAFGLLHSWLAELPNLYYSEYNPSQPGVRREDLMNLSYASSEFDFVFCSETLEHIPDYRRGLREIHRVLKLGGVLFLTVPLLWYTRTRQRARIDTEKGTITHLLPPSYHNSPLNEMPGLDFLVTYDFGSDFLAEVSIAGFSGELFLAPRYGPGPQNPYNVVMIGTRL